MLRSRVKRSHALIERPPAARGRFADEAATLRSRRISRSGARRNEKIGMGGFCLHASGFAGTRLQRCYSKRFRKLTGRRAMGLSGPGRVQHRGIRMGAMRVPTER